MTYNWNVPLHYVPGHLIELHSNASTLPILSAYSFFWRFSVEQYLPANAGVGLLHSCNLVLLPPPQVVEQEVQEPQLPHPPWTVTQIQYKVHMHSHTIRLWRLQNKCVAYHTRTMMLIAVFFLRRVSSTWWATIHFNNTLRPGTPLPSPSTANWTLTNAPIIPLTINYKRQIFRNMIQIHWSPFARFAIMFCYDK